MLDWKFNEAWNEINKLNEDTTATYVDYADIKKLAMKFPNGCIDYDGVISDEDKALINKLAAFEISMPGTSGEPRTGGLNRLVTFYNAWITEEAVFKYMSGDNCKFNKDELYKTNEIINYFDSSYNITIDTTEWSMNWSNESDRLLNTAGPVDITCDVVASGIVGEDQDEVLSDTMMFNLSYDVKNKYNDTQTIESLLSHAHNADFILVYDVQHKKLALYKQYNKKMYGYVNEVDFDISNKLLKTNSYNWLDFAYSDQILTDEVLTKIKQTRQASMQYNKKYKK